jgi:plasmid stability protein
VANVDERLVQSPRERAAAPERRAKAEYREIFAKTRRAPQRKAFAEVLMGIPNVGTDADFARVDDGDAANVFG